MNLHIKNMVCSRCKMVVKAELEKLGFNPISVELGEVALKEELTSEEKLKIDKALQQYGFELIEDRKKQLVEQVKNLIVDLVHHNRSALKINLSAYLSEKINAEYSGLTAAFSEIEHQTIEKYFIAQKIEKAKELITYGDLSLGEIAFRLNYSSIAHLSAQFKKVTGLTPSAFKNELNNRKSLDII